MALTGSSNYRIAFSLVVLRFFLPPIFLALVFSRAVFPLGYPVYFAAIPIYWACNIKYHRIRKWFIVRKLGARLAPEVRGKWPGNLDVLVRMGKNFQDGYAGETIANLFDELNSDTINLRIMWEDIIITKDPRVIQTVLATGFDKFHKGPLLKVLLRGLFGDGIFNNDGEEWKAHRALTKPFFARERVQDFDLFDRYTDKLVNILRETSSTDESVDVQDLFGRFTMDAAGEFLFGTSELNTLDLPLPKPGVARLGPKGSAPEGEYGGFVSAFEEVQIRVLRRAQTFLWPLWEFWTDSSKAPNAVIDAWILPLVEKALNEKNQRIRDDQKLDDDEGSLTDHLVQSTNDKRLIRDELFNILLAARDTTASLLSFLIYMLAEHPEVATRLREEIVQAVPSGPPTYEDIRKMKYLRACLNETLRLFSPVPFNERASTQPSVFPAKLGEKGIFMPGPNTSIVYSDMLLHRRKDLWGSDAEEFDPMRWIDSRLDRLTRDPFAFLPFNAGPRICLGQNFAYNEASFVMVRIMQAFEGFELRQAEDAPKGSNPPEFWQERKGRNKVEKIWPVAAITMFSKGGIWVRMIPAKSEAT